jgi:hypothetical protein
MYENTRDLSKFGQRERAIAGELLRTLGTVRDKTKYLDHDVAVEFNPMSGFVFLVDDSYNVAMMNGHDLEDFHTCPNCGGEEVASDFREYNTDECCQEYADELGLE